MITYRPYNVVIPKFIVHDSFVGGLKAVYKAFADADLQEDEYLIGIAAGNATEVRVIFEQLLGMGVSFNENTESSDDFTVLAKEGIWWNVPWLVSNDIGSWFIADVEAPV